MLAVGSWPEGDRRGTGRDGCGPWEFCVQWGDSELAEGRVTGELEGWAGEVELPTLNPVEVTELFNLLKQ